MPAKKSTKTKKRKTVGEILNAYYAARVARTRKATKGRQRGPLGPGAIARLYRAGVIGFGYGVKLTNGSLTPVIGARVYVSRKRGLSAIDRADRIPDVLLEETDEPIDTDVVESGKLRLLPADSDPGVKSADSDPGVKSSESAWLPKDLAMLRSPQRPLSSGCSVGPDLGSMIIMAGTLGCFVKDSSGAVHMLSNNHVLADSRLVGHPTSVPNGSDIFQPGTLDRSDQYILDMLIHGNQEQMSVATLSQVISIQPANPFTTANPPENRVDAAIAKVTKPADRPVASPLYTLPDIPTLLSPPNPYTRSDLNLTAVGKVGRTTGATIGLVVDTEANLWIPYGEEDEFDKYAWFVDQLTVVPVGRDPSFSDSGDSGSAVFDVKTQRIVGLLFAGSSEGQTFVNPIDAVFSALNVTLAS